MLCCAYADILRQGIISLALPRPEFMWVSNYRLWTQQDISTLQYFLRADVAVIEQIRGTLKLP